MGQVRRCFLGGGSGTVGINATDADADGSARAGGAGGSGVVGIVVGGGEGLSPAAASVPSRGRVSGGRVLRLANRFAFELAGAAASGRSSVLPPIRSISVTTRARSAASGLSER